MYAVSSRYARGQAHARFTPMDTEDSQGYRIEASGTGRRWCKFVKRKDWLFGRSP